MILTTQNQVENIAIMSMIIRHIKAVINLNFGFIGGIKGCKYIVTRDKIIPDNVNIINNCKNLLLERFG